MKNVIVALLRWVYWYPFRILIQQIPINSAYTFARPFVSAYYYVAKGKRKKIAQGLIVMYEGKISQKEINKLAYETLNNSFKSSIDKFFYPKLNKSYCEKNIEYIGLENLDEALKAGKGVVLLHGHLGNPHLIMPATLQ